MKVRASLHSSSYQRSANSNVIKVFSKKETIQIYSAQRSSGSRPLNINQLNYYGASVYVEQNLCFNGALFALNLVSRTQEEKQPRREQPPTQSSIKEINCSH